MTKKVLTIAVPILSIETVPYGPAVINGILRYHGYDCSAWDLNIDLYHRFKNEWNETVDKFANRVYRSNDHGSAADNKIIIKTLKAMVKNKLIDENPDIILLSVFSNQSLDLVIPLSSFIKEMLPNCYLAVGGRGLDNIERVTKQTYAEFFNQYLPVDCWYIGDAENNLLKMVEQKIDGVFYSPAVSSKDLENLPPAYWQGYDLSLYQTKNDKIRFPVIGSKGCVRECTFCDVAASWPKYVYKPGEDIAKEMIDIYHNKGVTNFEFTDNLVNGSIKNFRAMNSYIAENLPDTLDYYGYAICRPKNQFPKTDFELAAKAGASHFKIGIESGSDRVRFDLKKKFTNEDITWFAENCYDNNITQTWLMFVGYPTETEQDFQDSITLLKNHSHLTDGGKIKVFLSLPMMLTTGSAFMQKYGEEYGLGHNNDQWSDFFWTSTIYTRNTFDVRVDRWKRFVDAINKYGYDSQSSRQAEKFLEIEGVEKIYKEMYKNGKKIIPISTTTVHVNKETHV